MGIYDVILFHAEQIKAEKWAAYEALLKSTYANGANAYLSTIVKGSGIEHRRRVEIKALKIAGGLAPYEPIPALILVPNKFTGKKRCRGCRTWKPVKDFSPHPDTVDLCQSQCKACRAEKARETYRQRWKNAA